jgi:hypothetical protein
VVAIFPGGFTADAGQRVFGDDLIADAPEDLVGLS